MYRVIGKEPIYKIIVDLSNIGHNDRAAINKRL